MEHLVTQMKLSEIQLETLIGHPVYESYVLEFKVRIINETSCITI